MELMHPALKASRENVCRSAFVQFLVTAFESKECCLSTERNRRVRDSDRFSLAGDGTCLAPESTVVVLSDQLPHDRDHLPDHLSISLSELLPPMNANRIGVNY
jgi:hypothetical protein